MKVLTGSKFGVSNTCMKSDQTPPAPPARRAGEAEPAAAMPAEAAARRGYNQGARALAAERTAERILDAFERRIRTQWFEEITLDAVARDAEVTVPTVVRRFGGKEGLLDAVQERIAVEIIERRGIRPGAGCAAIRSVVDDYEAIGDLIIRFLAQEERHAPFKVMNGIGRAHHRAWIAAAFGPWLEPLEPAAREARLDALVMATDVYVWQVVRRDMGRPRAQVEALMRSFVEAIVGETARPLPLPGSDSCPEEVHPDE